MKPKYAWIEANQTDGSARALGYIEPDAPHDMTVADAVIDSLEGWGEVAQNIIITTAPDPWHIDNVLPQACAVLRGRIVGGIKLPVHETLSPLFGENRLTRALARRKWRKVGEHLKVIHDITGKDLVVVEAETALYPYNFGERGYPSSDALQDVLSVLPPLDILWHAVQIIRGRELQSEKFVHDFCSQRLQTRRMFFTEGYFGFGPWGRTDETRKRLYTAMQNITLHNGLFDMFYVSTEQPKPEDRYSPQEVAHTIKSHYMPDAIIYPVGKLQGGTGPLEWSRCRKPLLNALEDYKTGASNGQPTNGQDSRGGGGREK